MASRINVLPKNLINQIAAGEVIVRPASVVKELLENSIDAHASSINVSISNGCRDIKVTDDGEGMSPEDARICFNRHTTSKIAVLEDIEKINHGDVIVAGMTTPALMTKGMGRAGAIITDEGGLTCHAAALSREFKIPALIGTGNATGLLKDGDIVEINTEKGIAKILK